MAYIGILRAREGSILRMERSKLDQVRVMSIELYISLNRACGDEAVS